MKIEITPELEALLEEAGKDPMPKSPLTLAVFGVLRALIAEQCPPMEIETDIMAALEKRKG